MAAIPALRVMISSRSLSRVFDSDIQLAELRARLKEKLRSIRWFAGDPASLAGRDQELFDVWIHEDTPAEDGGESTFEISIQRIKWADIVIVLYTGEAGSSASDDELGICHAELFEALSRRPDIVAVVDMTPLSDSKLARDRTFREYVDRLQLFRRTAGDEATLQQVVLELLQDRVAVLARRGGRGAGRRRDKGRALDWNRLDLDKRRSAMRTALVQELSPASASKRGTLLKAGLYAGREAMVRPDAIPASLSVAPAREKVGQPFLRDHELSARLEEENLPGVIHIIACHRGVTETQALSILGTPDAIAVSGEFGVYVADHVQKIQLIFLSECSDDTAVALAVRQLRGWLSESGEGPRVLDRAVARRKILTTIAEVQDEGR